MSLRRRGRVAIVCLFLGTAEAKAGMPSVTLADLRTAMRTGLTEVGRQRLEVISFFLLVLIGCAWLVQRVWNSMRTEFPILPRLSFPRAVGVIVLLGLLFVLVLTMISGARELMTPGGLGEGRADVPARPRKPARSCPNQCACRVDPEARRASPVLGIGTWQGGRSSRAPR